MISLFNKSARLHIDCHHYGTQHVCDNFLNVGCFLQESFLDALAAIWCKLQAPNCWVGPPYHGALSKIPNFKELLDEAEAVLACTPKLSLT